MSYLLTFLVSFAFSFVGSIPPATINLTIVQLGLEKKTDLAWKLALGAALIEYPYAWFAVTFESLLKSSPIIVENFHLITAVVMILLGGLNLLASNKPSKFKQKFNDSGFRRGLILGILNPLAMPFWIGVTAYLESQHWVDLSDTAGLHSYLLGVSIGGFTLLVILGHIAKRIVSNFENNAYIKKIPGIAMLILGVIAFIQYILL